VGRRRFGGRVVGSTDAEQATARSTLRARFDRVSSFTRGLSAADAAEWLKVRQQWATDAALLLPSMADARVTYWSGVLHGWETKLLESPVAADFAKAQAAPANDTSAPAAAGSRWDASGIGWVVVAFIVAKLWGR